MRLAINYTIKALLCLQGKEKDISEKAIGWHTTDIFDDNWWKRNLFIKKEHQLYRFENWKNEKDFTCVSVSVYKGLKGFGPTIFYKYKEDEK